MLYKAIILIAGAMVSCKCQADDRTSVDCGTLNVGQERNVRFTIKNEGRTPKIIDDLFVCCGNPSPHVSATAIEPGQAVEFTQVIKRRRPGPFVVTTGVRFSGSNTDAITYRITGRAAQPVKALVGWKGTPLTGVDGTEKEVRLPRVHQRHAALCVILSSMAAEPHFGDSLESIASKYFVMDHTGVDCQATALSEERGAPDTNDSVVAVVRQRAEQSSIPLDTNLGGERATLHCHLTAKAPLPIGELTDTIIASFKDGSECYIPLTFRVVGDVFADSSILNFGSISRTETTQRTMGIHFTNGSRRWKNIRWKAEGKLADVVTVTAADVAASVDDLCIQITLDGTRIPLDARGFQSCRLVISDEADSTHITLLLCGYL